MSVDYDRQLNIRAPQAIIDALEAIMRRESSNKSEVVRDLIRAKEQEYDLWPPEREDDEGEQ